MKVGIVGQRGNQRAVSVAGDVAERLQLADVEVVVDEATREAMLENAAAGETFATPEAVPDGIAVDDLSLCRLAVSIGGDGTFLYTARGAGTTPIMGVNLGEVGFLNAVPPSEAVETVEEAVERIQRSGAARTRRLPRLSVSTEDWSLPAAVNDIVVLGPQRGRGNGISAEVRVDGSLYTRDQADGVLVATATGSTAYNLSEGGPIVHPETRSFVVTEMCGQEPMPPLVVDSSVEIHIRVTDADNAVVVSDGRITRSVETPAEVVVKRADKPVRIAGPPLDFFAALDKLD